MQGGYGKHGLRIRR
ncbi:hypothetical protein OM241_25400 [Escherichia albertii]|nr:hypothetical protein [Escherichia coli]MCJ2530671.1 hypothetical protein [Escherichia coli]MCJ2530672.1 hypothetical protein [Escherichia coli]MCZ9051437.1 hypothetical protein [Escherichia albertii]